MPVTVELFVEDVEASVRFYTEKLGFQLSRMERDADGDNRATFAVLSLGSAAILIADRALEGDLALPPGGGVHIRIMVDDVDAMHARALGAGVPIVGDIADRSYGLRDFIVEDPDGFRLRFAAPTS